MFGRQGSRRGTNGSSQGSQSRLKKGSATSVLQSSHAHGHGSSKLLLSMEEQLNMPLDLTQRRRFQYVPQGQLFKEKSRTWVGGRGSSSSSSIGSVGGTHADGKKKRKKKHEKKDRFRFRSLRRPREKRSKAPDASLASFGTQSSFYNDVTFSSTQHATNSNGDGDGEQGERREKKGKGFLTALNTKQRSRVGVLDGTSSNNTSVARGSISSDSDDYIFSDPETHSGSKHRRTAKNKRRVTAGRASDADSESGDESDDDGDARWAHGRTRTQSDRSFSSSFAGPPGETSMRHSCDVSTYSGNVTTGELADPLRDGNALNLVRHRIRFDHRMDGMPSAALTPTTVHLIQNSIFSQDNKPTIEPIEEPYTGSPQLRMPSHAAIISSIPPLKDTATNAKLAWENTANLHGQSANEAFAGVTRPDVVSVLPEEEGRVFETIRTLSHDHKRFLEDVRKEHARLEKDVPQVSSAMTYFKPSTLAHLFPSTYNYDKRCGDVEDPLFDAEAVQAVFAQSLTTEESVSEYAEYRRQLAEAKQRKKQEEGEGVADEKRRRVAKDAEPGTPAIGVAGPIDVSERDATGDHGKLSKETEALSGLFSFSKQPSAESRKRLEKRSTSISYGFDNDGELESVPEGADALEGTEEVMMLDKDGLLDMVQRRVHRLKSVSTANPPGHRVRLNTTTEASTTDDLLTALSSQRASKASLTSSTREDVDDDDEDGGYMHVDANTRHSSKRGSKSGGGDDEGESDGDGDGDGDDGEGENSDGGLARSDVIAPSRSKDEKGGKKKKQQKKKRELSRSSSFFRRKLSDDHVQSILQSVSQPAPDTTTTSSSTAIATTATGANLDSGDGVVAEDGEEEVFGFGFSGMISNMFFQEEASVPHTAVASLLERRPSSYLSERAMPASTGVQTPVATRAPNGSINNDDDDDNAKTAVQLREKKSGNAAHAKRQSKRVSSFLTDADFGFGSALDEDADAEGSVFELGDLSTVDNGNDDGVPAEHAAAKEAFDDAVLALKGAVERSVRTGTSSAEREVIHRDLLILRKQLSKLDNMPQAVEDSKVVHILDRILTTVMVDVDVVLSVLGIVASCASGARLIVDAGLVPDLSHLLKNAPVAPFAATVISQIGLHSSAKDLLAAVDLSTFFEKLPEFSFVIAELCLGFLSAAAESLGNMSVIAHPALARALLQILQKLTNEGLDKAPVLCDHVLNLLERLKLHSPGVVQEAVTSFKTTQELVGQIQEQDRRVSVRANPLLSSP